MFLGKRKAGHEAPPFVYSDCVEESELPRCCQSTCRSAMTVAVAVPPSWLKETCHAVVPGP